MQRRWGNQARGESPKETTGNLQALPLRCSIPHRCPENPNYSTFKCKTLPQHPVVMFFLVAMVLSPARTAIAITRSLWCYLWRPQHMPSLRRYGAIAGTHSSPHNTLLCVTIEDILAPKTSPPSILPRAIHALLFSGSCSRAFS